MLKNRTNDSLWGIPQKVAFFINAKDITLLEDKFNKIDLENPELDAMLDEDDAGEEAAELYEHYRVVADKGQQLLRVDKFLLDHLKDTSRNRIQAAAKAGFIHVNERPVKAIIALNLWRGNIIARSSALRK